MAIPSPGRSIPHEQRALRYPCRDQTGARAHDAAWYEDHARHRGRCGRAPGLRHEEARHDRHPRRSPLGRHRLAERPGPVRHRLAGHGGPSPTGTGRRRPAHRVPGLDVHRALPAAHRRGPPRDHRRAGGACRHRRSAPGPIAAVGDRRAVLAVVPAGPLAGAGAHADGRDRRRPGHLGPGRLHAQGDRRAAGLAGAVRHPAAHARGRPGPAAAAQGSRKAERGDRPAPHRTRPAGPPRDRHLPQHRDAHQRTRLALHAGRPLLLHPLRALRAPDPHPSRQHRMGIPGAAAVPTTGAQPPERLGARRFGGRDPGPAAIRACAQHPAEQGLAAPGRTGTAAQPVAPEQLRGRGDDRDRPVARGAGRQIRSAGHGGDVEMGAQGGGGHGARGDREVARLLRCAECRSVGRPPGNARHQHTHRTGPGTGDPVPGGARIHQREAGVAARGEGRCGERSPQQAGRGGVQAAVGTPAGARLERHPPRRRRPERTPRGTTGGRSSNGELPADRQ